MRVTVPAALGTSAPERVAGLVAAAGARKVCCVNTDQTSFEVLRQAMIDRLAGHATQGHGRRAVLRAYAIQRIMEELKQPATTYEPETVQAVLGLAVARHLLAHPRSRKLRAVVGWPEFLSWCHWRGLTAADLDEDFAATVVLHGCRVHVGGQGASGGTLRLVTATGYLLAFRRIPPGHIPAGRDFLEVFDSLTAHHDVQEAAAIAMDVVSTPAKVHAPVLHRPGRAQAPSR